MNQHESSGSDTGAQSPGNFLVSAPSLSLPKGGGAIRGIGEKFAANPVTGTGSMSVPIFTSPGRSGFGPQLSLSYDSGAGNGPFGVGWSLSLPAITRKTDKGLPQYNDATESDVFILSGAEDLVPVYRQDADNTWVINHPGYKRDSDGFWRDADGNLVIQEDDRNGYRVRRYRPRIEGLFARIECWTNTADATDVYWRSISKDNITTWYGQSPESRIFDPDNSQRIFSWLICASYDDKGNAIVYKYAGENDENIELAQAHERHHVRTANRYIKRIKYGNRQPNRDAGWQATAPAELSDWMFEVVFDYGEGHFRSLEPDPNTPVDEQYHFVLATASPDLSWDSPSRGWPIRPDEFSSYRAGFELRTCRLCRRVLMFHRFPDELGTLACLVRSTGFVYSEGPVASFITSVVQSGYVYLPTSDCADRYLQRSLPALEFGYSPAPDAAALAGRPVEQADAESLENLPIGLDGSSYQWVDLDGEGTSGILTEQAGGWHYKRNCSANQRDGERTVARFSPTEIVARTPLSGLAGGAQLLDLAGDGQVDLVEMGGPLRGFYERDDDAGWAPFRPFVSWPNLDAHDPNLRFVDLTGDGHADILITTSNTLIWHPSLAEEGFGPAVHLNLPRYEEQGPRLVFHDGAQSIYLADLSGDGLSDLVRIRNGDVCYWPNLGYGRFGAKVTMDNAPWLDTADQFDQRRIRLVDTDGSGTTDIIYLRRDGAQVYFNQSGNSWSDGAALPQFPPIDNLSSVQALDLLGNGIACLVWSSPLPDNRRGPLRYIALMEEKPHLMVSVKNNLGAETVVRYVPSTKFYLDDRENGRPWITRLPFPVHVVERVETYDRVSRNRFVTSYTYHHGYFDGIEREFRGFAMVEQKDTEEIGTVPPDAVADTNWEPASFVPPVLTRTWFHTGAYFGSDRISRQLAAEYYHEEDPNSLMELPDTILPETVRLADGGRVPYTYSAEEQREACRALKGSILRQEIYALDGSEKEGRPYSVSERNYTIEGLQPRGGGRHAIFFAHLRETIDAHYERMLYDVGGTLLADPRVSHTMALEVDGFGNSLKAVAIGYGRRFADPDEVLSEDDKDEQKRIHVTFSENEYTGAVEQNDDYRTPLIAEARTYEIVKPDAGEPLITNLFRFEELAARLQDASDGSHDLLYEDIDAAGAIDDRPWRRLIERVRTLYRRNDLDGLLPLKDMHSMALPGESFKLAFTPGLLDTIFRRRRPDGSFEDLLPDPLSVLGHPAGDGGYVELDGDGSWWIPSGRVFFSPDAGTNAAGELDYARQHFFLPARYRDPFHTDQLPTETTVRYDPYDLLVQETWDALGNRVTAGERDQDGVLLASGLDYRVLQPNQITDPNDNRSAAAFDALGMVAGTAVMGKNPDLGFKADGDLVDAQFVADLTPRQIAEFLASPRDVAIGLLGSATTRIVYDLDCFKASGLPAFAATIARETHLHDPLPADGLKVQVSFSYSDGFGREIQKKIQAEPEKTNGVAGPPRWVGSGWTIFNNKGKPVRQYEPFFIPTHQFEFAVAVGVSPVLFYDPVERVVATLHPNHTFEKVVFDPWRQATWDVNDTVRLDPRTDPDIAGYTRGYFDTLPPDWQTWLQRRIADPQRPPVDSYGGNPEQDAAVRSMAHAATPAVAFLDTLGRPFLTVADDGPDKNARPQKFRTLIRLDIENNQREVVDAKGRLVVCYDYDMLGNRIHQASMEAGERWTLNDVAGKSFYAWDSRGHQFRSVYDQLRRPTGVYLWAGADPELLVGRTVYGEAQPDAPAHNLRGKPYQVFDQAGVVTTEAYDFKGNLLRGARQLAVEYKATLDWSRPVARETESFTSSTSYDALNRPVALITPDGSTIRPAYNEANLLERIAANLRGDATATPFVTNIDYNAKGQRTLIEYGILNKQDESKVRTAYEYDEKTFRLTRLRTTRSKSTRLQDLSYCYDPAGNITHIRDDAQQTIYFDNQRVEPSGDYIYDAIYRLVEARGREHLGQSGGQPNPPTPPDAFNAFHSGLPHPGDCNAMGTYIEQYVYDAVGNFLSMQHRGVRSANPGWSRSYDYAEPSRLERGKKSNRLSSTRLGQATEHYGYEGSAGLHGNITSMPHLQLMQWDEHDQLRATAQQVVNDGTPETTWYVYDAAGQRVRKVTESAKTVDEARAGAQPRRLKERIYLGGYELYREYGATGTITLERESLHIMDDKRRVALVETRTHGNDGSQPQLVRYQLDNHLGSACLELNQAGTVISYEEYYPYGSTSYQAVNQSIKAAAKRYRYTGKERDEESGLYYRGARYYACWVGRWVSCDPGGITDGSNVYQYTRSNPVKYLDNSGYSSVPSMPQIDDLISFVNRPPVDIKAAVNEINRQKNMQVMGEFHGQFFQGTKYDYNSFKSTILMSEKLETISTIASSPAAAVTSFFTNDPKAIKLAASLETLGMTAIGVVGLAMRARRINDNRTSVKEKIPPPITDQSTAKPSPPEQKPLIVTDVTDQATSGVLKLPSKTTSDMKYPLGIPAKTGARLCHSIRLSLNLEHVGNVAVAESVIEGKRELRVSASVRDVPKSLVGNPNKIVFGTRPSGVLSREFDTEYRILSDIAQILPESAKGVISLYTEKAPCASCLDVIGQFRERFPNITLNVQWGTWGTTGSLNHINLLR